MKSLILRGTLALFAFIVFAAALPATTNAADLSPRHCLWNGQFTAADSPVMYGGNSYVLDQNCEPTATISVFTARFTTASGVSTYSVTSKSNDSISVQTVCVRRFFGLCLRNERLMYVTKGTSTLTSGTIPILRPGDSITLEWQCQPFQYLLWTSEVQGWDRQFNKLRTTLFQYSSVTSGTGFNTGGALSGSVTLTPQDSTKYILRCGDAGYIPPEIEIQVDRPVGSISASPTTVRTGGSTLLTWSARNVKNNSCRITGPGGGVVSGSQANSGSGLSSGPISATTSPTYFTLTCERYTGVLESWQSNPITVTNTCLSARDPALPGICAFSASPGVVLQGGATTLSWYCPLPNTTYTIERQEIANGPWSSVVSGAVPASRAGTRIGNPLVNTTYRLTCSGNGTPGVGTAAVAVSQPTLTLAASTYEVPVGGITRLTWNSQNVNTNSCRLTFGSTVISNAMSNSVGLAVTPAPLPATYTLTCATPASVARTAPAPTTSVLIYEAGNGPSVASFYGNPSSVRKGSSTTLFWTGTNLPATCALTSNPVISSLPSSVSSTLTGNLTGVQTGPIQQRTEFRLSCGPTGSGNTVITIIPIFQEI